MPPLRLLLLVLLSLLLASPAWGQQRSVIDLAQREVQLPGQVERVICSGPGCLRLLAYLQATELVVGVDEMETRNSAFDPRPYAKANPHLAKLPVFGGFRGQDRPEQILALNPGPQLIFKTAPTMGHDPEELQHKTGLPVLVLDEGDLVAAPERLFHSLRLMAQVIDREERAEEVIAFFQATLADLHARTEQLPPEQLRRAYVGGIAFRGARGLLSTELGYPPFVLARAVNIAHSPGGPQKGQLDLNREQLLINEPELLFFDLAGARSSGQTAADKLQHNPVFAPLAAVRDGQVHGLLPANWYGRNHGSVLINAYLVGRTLYPERFTDITPRAMGEAIYSGLFGRPVFSAMVETCARPDLAPLPL